MSLFHSLIVLHDELNILNSLIFSFELVHIVALIIPNTLTSLLLLLPNLTLKLNSDLK